MFNPRLNQIYTGIMCTYQSLGNGLGIKKYRSKDTAKESYRLQNLFCQFGFAPKVHGWLNAEKKAFLTEEAILIYDRNLEKCRNSSLELENKWRHEIQKLIDEIFSIKMLLANDCVYEITGDSHLGNFGIINNKLVLIDFS